MAAVITSIKNIISMVANVSSAPLSMGDTRKTNDWILLLSPFTLVSWSSGTSCGRKAPIAGI
jgi:hypothetical protein